MTNTPLLDALRSDAFDRVCEAVRARQTVALTGLTEGLAVFFASALCRRLGLRVMVVTGNDLRATRAADDAMQLMGEGAAPLTGGELDLTRGVSSHEQTWRRLETLARVRRGEIRLLSVSLDALIQRMGDPEVFSAASLRLRAGDRLAPDELMTRLTRMGYERVELVEGKGQCARRGSIVDVYPPAAPAGLRIEYFDDAA